MLLSPDLSVFLIFV